ncbi:MAG: hypothetical protein KGL02_04340 [Acidobacteriota bacterium]|nr:hypothetical protein [Acidobacteriota bacterium]
MIWRGFASVLLLLLGIPAAVFACTCSQSAPGKCAVLPQDGVVFLGTVTGISAVPQASAASESADTPAGSPDSLADGSSAPVFRYRFRVQERFAGPVAATIDVFTGGDDGDCGYRFKDGAEYLVFTHEGADGRLYSTICDGTRPAADARALLPQLRAMRQGQHVASVFGMIRRVDRPFLDAPDAPDPPLAHVSIHLRSRWDRFETGTNSEGVYSLYDVHAGTYTLSARVSPHIELTAHSSANGLQPFHLQAGACYEYDVDALPTGEIRGSVIGPDSKPLPLASVELYRAGSYSAGRPGLWSFQGSKGTFDFDHIGRGRYILVFNRTNNLNPNSPFRRTFYPGVADLVEAKPIVLKEGERRLNLKLKLSEGLPTRHLRVRVKWTGSRPLGTVTVMAQADHGDNPAARLVAPGIYEFTLLEDSRYTISAWQDLIPQHLASRRGTSGCGVPARLDTEPVTLAAAGAPGQITLTFPSLGCGKIARSE